MGDSLGLKDGVVVGVSEGPIVGDDVGVTVQLSKKKKGVAFSFRQGNTRVGVDVG